MTTKQINKQSSIEINDIKLLQDPRMGSQTGKCGTCGNYSNNCIGHCGHIPLPFPIFQPLLAQQYTTLFELVCLNCLKLPIQNKRGDLKVQIRALRSKTSRSEKKCPHCNQVLENFKIEYLERGKIKSKIPLHFKCTKFQAYHIKKIIDNDNQIAKGGEEQVILSLKYIDKILRRLATQQEVRKLIRNGRQFECFMIQSVPVPPNSLRVLPQQTQSHSMNTVYGIIITSIQSLSKQQIFVDDLYLAPLEKYIQLLYNRIIVGSRVVLYKDTSRNLKPQKKQLLLDVLGVSNQEPASALSQSLTKKGWFRQYISSSRVDMSARTVVVGDPWLNVDQVIIPKFFAENLFMPVRVNNVNIERMKSLILNYPNYPCAMRRVFNKITYSITEENKQIQSMQCNLGDVVMIQLLDGDVVLVQRYPTVREESFTCMTIKVEDTKAIKLPLSVIEKQGADFDGDEMEIFVLPSRSDCMEAIGCISACSQFITYQSGLNVIGGNTKIQNISPGIFHLQNEDFKNKHFLDLTGKNDDDMIKGIDIIQKAFEQKIYTGKQGKQLLESINYNDGSIIVENGKFKKIETGLVSDNSNFLTYIQFHHGQHVAIKIINEITHLAYRVNHISASTVLNNMFLTKDQKQQLRSIDLSRLKVLQDIIDDYYTGKIVAPVGFDLKMYFEKIYQDRLFDDEKMQQTKLLDYIKIPGANFLNKFYNNSTSNVVFAVSHIGQIFDQGQRVQDDKCYKRSIISYPKFQPTPQSQGYVLGNLYDGVLQKEMFMLAISERKSMYIKGNNTAVAGYLSRRLNQGAGNMFARPNGIIASDNNQIISLQYGSAGYNPRNYVVIPFDKHKITMEEFDAQYKTHPRYNELLQIRNDILQNEKILQQTIPKYNGTKQLIIPFKFDQDTISEQELDNILSCRLCSKMSDDFKEIIIAQTYMFYIYALFFLKVDPKSTYKVVDKYLDSLVQIGEPVGMKAALACSQPYVQGMLKAIHTKGGAMTIIQEEFTTGVTRYKELVTGDKGPTVVSFQLLGKAKYNIDKNIKFITKYQTIKFTNLKPQIQIYQSFDQYVGNKDKMKQAIQDINIFQNSHFSRYIMTLTFDIKQLAYYLIDIKQMMENIIKENTAYIKTIIPFQDGDKIVMVVYCDINVGKQQISMIKNFLLQNQLLGSKLFYNLYFDPPTELKEGQSYRIIGNISNSKHEIQKNALLNIYSIPGVDPASIYCSDPKQYYEHCGIIRARISLYNELHTNLVSDDATKQVQATHVRLITDLLTQSGDLSSFTRNSYRKEGLRDIYSLLLFEQGDVFLSNELCDPHLQITNTSLNSCIFGTRSELGTTVSQIVFDNCLRKQDQSKLEEQM